MTQREELEKMQEILRDKIENTIPDYSMLISGVRSRPI